jgi:hypothetical protein
MYEECRHIMPNGRKCHSPALRNLSYCYYHDALHRAGRAPAAGKPMLIPPIEDASGIQIALTQILGALNSPYMDTRRAGLLLYGLQIAAQLARRATAPKPEDAVRILCNQSGNPISDSSSIENESQILAPAKTVCEPPADCVSCCRRDQCEDFELYEDEVEDLEAEQESEDDESEDDESEDDESDDES